MSLVPANEILQVGGLAALDNHPLDEKMEDSKAHVEHVELATGVTKAGENFRGIQEAGISAESYELSLSTWQCFRLYRKV